VFFKLKKFTGVLCVVFLLLTVVFVLQINASGKDDITLYKGNIENAADVIARFPTIEEGRETYDRMMGIIDSFKSILDNDSPIDLQDIENKCRYVLDIHKKTEILEWCLLELGFDQTISLLPGEGIELTLPSYCLDAAKSGPSADEFYSMEKISGDQSVWLKPLLEYASAHAGKDLPVQSLIWNMGRKILYKDLPVNEQALLSTVVPDAAKRYRGSVAKKLFGRLKREVRNRVDIIRDVEHQAQLINERKSKLKLILPTFDVFRLENGLLVKVKSTGSYSKTTLIIVNPRENLEKSGRARSFNLADIPGFSAFSSEIITDQGIHHPFNNLTFVGAGYSPDSMNPVVMLSSSGGEGKWGKSKDWWNNNKGSIKKWSDRAGTAKDVIDSYNEGGLEGVKDYTTGRGFDASLNVFKAFQKGNPQAESAFELFRNFNKDLQKAHNDKQDRGNKNKLKPFRPGDYKFKPGRGDVQPLATGGW